jgi:hypothetical protein
MDPGHNGGTTWWYDLMVDLIAQSQFGGRPTFSVFNKEGLAERSKLTAHAPAHNLS